MPKLLNASAYIESTAAQLLRPRVDLLTKDGGLDYKELNKRIIAINRTENIDATYNPIYCNISKEVCAVERVESFNINDNVLSTDDSYFIKTNKVFIRTSNGTVVVSATGFIGDNITVNVNKLIASVSLSAVSKSGEALSGITSLDKTSLIIDESIKNPINIDFSDESNILLTINPLANNTIPVIFTPDNSEFKPSRLNLDIVVLDERNEAVIPEIEEGTYLSVSALSSSNATKFKDQSGELTVSNAATLVGNIINSETKSVLNAVTCEVEVGTKFPEMPTNYTMSGVDNAEKLRNTLFAKVTLKQSTIRDLTVILPIKYLSDTRDVLKPFTSFSYEQTNVLELTYENSGFTFKGENGVVSNSVVETVISVSAENSEGDVNLTVSNAVIEKSINENHESTKASITITPEDNSTSPLKYNLRIKDNRPVRAKENWTATQNFSTVIESTDFNAGNLGDEWVGDSLPVSGSLTNIKNQFGKTILAASLLFYSLDDFDANLNSFSTKGNPLKILGNNGVASNKAEAVLHVLTAEFEKLNIPIIITVTDNR